MKESENLNKVELIGVTSQSDIASDLKRLVAALKKQGFNVTPAKENRSSTRIGRKQKRTGSERNAYAA